MKRKLLALAVLAAPASAMAALPESVTTAMGTATADITTAFGILIGVAVVIFALRKVYRVFGG